MLLVKGYDEKLELFKNLSQVDAQNQDQEQYQTEKWNPVTFALYNGNLDLVRYLL